MQKTETCSLTCHNLLKKKNIFYRWLADPLGKTKCPTKDQCKTKFIEIVEDLQESAEAVEESKIAYHIPKEKPRENKLRQAREAYQQTVTEHQKMEKSFVKEMNHLCEGLDSFENDRLTVLKNALNVYQSAINEQGKEREFRNKRVEEMKQYFNTINGFSVEDAVKQWLDSVKQTYVFSDYPIDPFREEDVIQVIHSTDDMEAQVKASKADEGNINMATVKDDNKKRKFKNFFKKNKQKQ